MQNSSSYSGVHQACNRRNIFAAPSAQASLETDWGFLVWGFFLDLVLGFWFFFFSKLLTAKF